MAAHAAAVLPGAIRESSWWLVGQIAQLMRDALVVTPVGRPERRQLLGHYGTAQCALAERHDLVVLNEAIPFLNEVANEPSNDLDTRLGASSFLVRLWAIRHRRAPSRMTLSRYANALNELIGMAPDEHPTKPLVMADLATALVNARQHGLGAADHDALHDALQLVSAAVRLVHAPHAWRVRMTRATVLYEMYELDPANAAALEGAIADLRSCLDLIREGESVGLGQIRLRLGTLLYRWHFVTGVLEHLLEAVDLLMRARVDLAGNRYELTTALSNFSAATLLAHELTGDERWHRDGLDAVRSALTLCDTMEEGRADALENLALHLTQRFERSGDTTALGEALEALASAVQATPEAGPERARRLCGFASAMSMSYKVTRRLAELDDAVGLTREALGMLPPDHQDRPYVLNRLGSLLRAYYPEHKDLSRMEEATDLLGKAVAGTPATSPDLVAYQLNQVGAILHWFGETGRADLLAAADDVAEDVLRRIPANHSARATALLARGMVKHQLSLQDPGKEILATSALEHFEAAAYAPDSPYRQIDAARKAALVAAGMKNWQRGASILAHAVSLLPRLASRRLLRGDQERQLAAFSGMVRDACAYALQADDPTGALVVLEQGRGILYSQALENRDDLAELRRRHPELATRLDACRARLVQPGTEELVLGTARDDVHAAAEQWEDLVGQARQLDGFEKLFTVLNLDDLRALADEGPIVTINVAPLRTDALALTSSGLQVVELPDARADVLRLHYLRFMSALEQRDSEQDIVDTLEWLWEAVAEPVLKRLEIGQQDHGAPWRRMWWSPTGPLVFLPLHAAGRHDTKDDAVPLTVIDRTVSSYTPTLRSLQHARSRRATTPEAARLLLVAVPNAPGKTPLPAASKEIEHLRTLLPAKPGVLEGDRAVRDVVLDALPRYEWAHFCCHAEQDVRIPTASHLVLHDHETAPLTVRDIARLNLDHAEFAYLSACATGRGGVALTEESIHLAAAFQLAGYQHVVATLWPISDTAGRFFTKEVYRRIVMNGPSAAAHAVHEAARSIRERLARSPRSWAAHFHTGA